MGQFAQTTKNTKKAKPASKQAKINNKKHILGAAARAVSSKSTTK